MTIQSDTVGNKFLGDCIYANHSIAYPTINFLQAHPHSSISAELTALFTASGLQYRNVLSQGDFDSTVAINKSLFAIAPASDTIDDRYIMAVNRFFGSAFEDLNGTFTYLGGVQMFDNLGYSHTNNTVTTTNLITNFKNIASSSDVLAIAYQGIGEALGFSTTPTTWSQVSWSGVSDGESLALFIYQYDFVNNKIGCRFLYTGILDAVNTNFNYYSENITTKSILMSGGGIGSSGYATTLTGSGATISGCHRINAANKILLKTGDAQYSIACSDAQTPSGTWATDLYVFDNNASLGYPSIGRVRNILAATGTYTLGKVVKIQGSVFPDAGGVNTYMPIGSFAGKTLLMKCYSSAA